MDKSRLISMNLDKSQCVTLIWLLNVTHWIFVLLCRQPNHVQQKCHPFHWNILIKISPITLIPLCHFYSWYFIINPSIYSCTISQTLDIGELFPFGVKEDWLAAVDDVIHHGLSQHFPLLVLSFLHHHLKDRSLSLVIAGFGSGAAHLFSLWNKGALVVFGLRSLTSSATLSHSLQRHLRFIPI